MVYVNVDIDLVIRRVAVHYFYAKVSFQTILSYSSAVRIFEISHRIVTSVFDSKRAQLFEILEYLPSPICYLTE